MNKKEELLKLLEQVLKEKPKHTYKENYAFHCPNPNCNHRKRKFEINLDITNNKNSYHCWICDLKGNNLFSLLKYVKADKKYFDKLADILGGSSSQGYLINNNDLKNKIINKPNNSQKNGIFVQKIFLPKNSAPLYESFNDFDYKNAYNYIINRRNVTIDDLIRYNIHYTNKDNFKYPNKIIIPSYDNNGNLNYFFSRSFYEAGIKHKSAPIKRDNIIIFEKFLNFKFPITIVEGGIDAIKVRINCTPTLTKTIQYILLDKILFYKTPVNLMYDYDVFWGGKVSKKLIYQLEKLLGSGIDVNIIKLPEGSDPGDFSFKENQNFIRNNKIKLDNKFIMKLKLNI
jgi:DNA primase